MVEKFIKNFCPKLSSFTSKILSSSATNSTISKYKQAIKSYLDIVDSRQAVVDAFITAFGANPEVFAAPEAGADTYNTSQDYSYKISEEAADILLTMFNNQVSDVLTFTDSSGYPYSMIRTVSSSPLRDGTVPIIATQTHPLSHKDTILYRDEQGDLYFNPIIRITGFYDANDVLDVAPISLEDAVSTLCVIGDVIDTGTILGNLHSLNDEYGFSHSSTIEAMISDLATFLNLAQPEYISDIVTRFVDYAWALVSYVGKVRIHSTSIYGLVNNLVINNELIELIRDVYDNITNGDVNQLVTCIRSRIDEKSSVVKRFGNKILVGFSRSGILGALGVIIELLKNVFTSEPDGYRVFNTSDSIPQAFSAGFIAIVTGIGQTLFQVLANVMNPVISIVGALGYTIFDIISNVINVNVSQEYASINDLDSCELISPYALFGAKITVTQSRIANVMIPNDEGKIVTIKSLLDWATLNGSPVLTLNWISCSIKMAYFQPEINYDENTVYADEIIINVFPTVANIDQFFPTDSIRNLWRNPTDISIPAVGDGFIKYDNWRTNYSNTISLLSTQISSMLRTSADFSCSFENDHDGNYTGYAYSDDYELRQAVYQNALMTIALVYRYTGQLITISNGSTSVPLKLSPTWTVKLNGTATPGIELCLGSVAASNMTFITYHDTPIFLQRDTSSYESIARAITGIQEASSAYFVGNLYLPAVIATRTNGPVYSNIYPSALENNGSVITYHDSYKDIPYFTPPKYVRGTVISTMVIGAIVTVATAVAVVGLTIGTKRLLNKQRAIREARVDAAWSELTKNPDAAHYETYRKAVKANNRFTRLFGGTKYDYVNYWHGDVSSTDSETPTSPFEDILSGNAGDETSLETKPIDSVGPIIKIITGNDLRD